MKLERSQSISRAELSELLLCWADNLRQEKPVDLAGTLVKLPSDLTVIVGFKKKGDIAQAKLKLYWTVADGAGTAGKEAGGDMSWVKKEMGRLLSSWRRSSAEGTTPTMGEAQEFRRLSAIFGERAKPNLKAGAAETLRTADKLVGAISDGDAAAVENTIDELVRLRRDYHNSFK